MTVEDERFQSLLEQVRDLHRLADELTSSTRLHENVRARLAWRSPPPLPPDERKLAGEVVEVLDYPRLSSYQARLLKRAFFDR